MARRKRKPLRIIGTNEADFLEKLAAGKIATGEPPHIQLREGTPDRVLTDEEIRVLERKARKIC